MSETITGQVKHIRFRNPENGWTVLILQQGENGSQPGLFDSIMKEAMADTVVGVLPEVHVGEQLELTGEWGTHPKFGLQFKVTSCKQTLPASAEGIRAYLSSDLINGIGPEYAKRIVDTFGAETLNILDNHISHLSQVDGIGPKRLETIRLSWAEHKNIKDIMIWLQGHGITPGLAVKIQKEYGDRAKEVLEKNPYVLTRIRGVGFKLADGVAMNLGIALDDPQRIQAGLVFALKQGAKAGHCYLSERELFSKAGELLAVAQDAIREQSDALSKDDRVVIDEERIYLTTYYDAEVEVAERIKFLVSRPNAMREFDKVDDWPKFLAKYQDEGVKPTKTQLKAVRAALTNRVTVITGGPGTGKTFLTKMIVKAAKDKGYSVALCSPTGRAAKRLSEATGSSASTVHRMLGYSPSQGWQVDADSPLFENLLIVDESSMLDARLAYRLMCGVSDKMHIVFVGDVDQLPSVGAGVILGDLIKSEAVTVIRLDTIFRQAKNSHIILNSHRINDGEMPVWNDGNSPDALMFGENDPEACTNLIVELIQGCIPQRQSSVIFGGKSRRQQGIAILNKQFRQFGITPDDIQVLAPMYRGAAGINALNERLQQALNPPMPDKEEKKFGNRTLRVHDKLIQTVNNYDVNIMNGDQGRLLEISTRRKELIVNFDGRTVAIEFGKAGSLVHAFAISIHRSQGSEYPVVIMPVMTTHYVMLVRNLLYTGVTRAKKLIVVVGQSKAIGIAVNNDSVKKRNSFLADRLHLDASAIKKE